MDAKVPADRAERQLVRKAMRGAVDRRLIGVRRERRGVQHQHLDLAHRGYFAASGWKPLK